MHYVSWNVLGLTCANYVIQAISRKQEFERSKTAQYSVMRALTAKKKKRFNANFGFQVDGKNKWLTLIQNASLYRVNHE